MNEAKEGSFAVVTGASSRIGLELAKQFAQNGFNLIIVAEDVAIIEARNEISKVYPVVVECVQVDLTTYDGVEILIDHIRSRSLPVHALAVNADFGVRAAIVEQTDLEAELKLIQLNVLSAVHLTKRLLPDMLQRREGRILFTSSDAANAPSPFNAAYAASNAFLQSFSESIRDELKDSGVHVTAMMMAETIRGTIPLAAEARLLRRGAPLKKTRARRGPKSDSTLLAKRFTAGRSNLSALTCPVKATVKLD